MTADNQTRPHTSVEDSSTTLLADVQPLSKTGQEETSKHIDAEPTGVEPTTDAESTTGASPSADEDVPISILKLFRFADWKDITLMSVGIVGAMLYGVLQPLLSLLLGDIVQPFIEFEMMRSSGQYPAGSPVYNASLDHLKTYVIQTLIWFVLTAIGSFIGAYLLQALWSWSGERQARRVRVAFIKNVMSQDLAWFDAHHAGDLTTRLSSDALLFQDGISEKVSLALGYCSQFLAGFIIAFVKSWQLTLVLLATLPAFGLSGFIVGKTIADGTAKTQSVYARAGAVAQEVLSNMRTVTAFGGQARAVKKFSDMLEDTVRVNERKSWISGAGFGVFFGLLYFLFGLGFWYGSRLQLRGELNGGTVLACLFAITIGAFSIINMGPSQQAIGKARGAAARLFRVIDSKPTIRGGCKTVPRLSGSIRFEDVKFAYPSRPGVPVVENLRIEANEGETVALVGSSGSGKSTCVQLLLRYFDLQDGRIIIDGHDLKDFEIKWWRQQVGLVSQEPILFDASIEDNIKFGAPDGVEITQEILEQACINANAHSFITSLPNGYKTLVGERGTFLSGGQKQRIAIARALIKAPKILLLDEATSALDTESEGIVQAALDRASQGRTTIVIAHRLSTIRNANKIIVMNKGQVVEMGTHDELVAKDNLYAQLVREQELKSGKPPKSVKSSKPAVPDEADTQSKVVQSDSRDDIGIASDNKSLSTTKDSFTKEQEEKAEMKRLLESGKNVSWRIFKLQWKEWPVLVVGIVCASIDGILLPAFGAILGQVLSIFSETGKDLERQANLWALVFLGLMCVNFIINLFKFGCFGVAGERLTRRIRETLFAAMVRQDIAWFDDDRHGTGSLTTMLSDHADRIQNLTGPNAANLLQMIVSMIASLVLAFSFSWQMTLVVLACVPFLVVGAVYETKVIEGTIGKTRLAYSKAAQTACDAMQHIATVKSLTREEYFVQDFQRRIDGPYVAGKRKALLGSIGFAYSQSLQFLVYGIAFYAGYRFVAANILTSGSVFRTVFVVLFGAISFQQAATFGPNVQKAKIAAVQYFELVDRVPLIDVDNLEGLTPVDVAGEVNFEKTVFSYPARLDVMILKGLDLKAHAGKNIALVGPSGGGKSTILGLLLRFYAASDGAVKLENYDVKNWKLSYLREQMSIVSQEPTLFTGTIRENIVYGHPHPEKVDDQDIEKVCRLANIYDFVQGLEHGFSTHISSTQCSGGQKQRLCIARALVRQPKVLLLDEATSALDTGSERVVQHALDAASVGRTTITIAHRLSTVQNADVIFVCNGGAVEEFGTHLELLNKNGLYSKLVKRQQLGSQ